MNKRITLLVAGSLMAMTTAAIASNKAETFSVSPVIGGITFEGKQHLESNLLYGARLGYNFTKEFGVEALFDYANTEGTLTGRNVDFYRYGGEMLYHFIPDNKLVPYLAAGYAAVNFKGDTATDSASKPRGAFDYGAGVKYFLMDNFALRGDVRHLIYRHNQTQQAVEYTVGAYIPFGGAAPAMKAIPAPAPAPEPVKVVAAPVAPPEPAPVVPVPVPVVVPPADSDNDGVIDSLDKCPNTPAGVAVDGNGCPVDSDKDGVADYLDKCPNTPAGVAVDNTGCPLDSDKDGVPDYLDKCPGTPAGVIVDKDGCPPPVEAAKLCKPAVINIQFDNNKADIKPLYHDELKKLAEFLAEFLNATGAIEGHTDNVGSKENNMKLSQSRADSVRNYIIKNFGITPERLSAKGFGQTKPIAGNKTAAGKQKNRRIETNFSCNGK